MRFADRSTTIRVFLLGSAIGAGAGAVLGLLFAPRSRADLRGDVKSKAGELLGGAQECLGRASNRSSFTLQDAKQVERDESAMLLHAGSIK